MSNENEKSLLSRIEQQTQQIKKLTEALAAERAAREAAEAECDELSRQLLSSQDRLSAELLNQEWVSKGSYHLRKSAITVIENLSGRWDSVGEVKCRINGEGGPVLAMMASDLLALLQKEKKRTPPPDKD